jgi:hypothetical protein
MHFRRQLIHKIKCLPFMLSLLCLPTFVGAAELVGGIEPDFSVSSSQPGIVRVSAPYPMKAMCSQRVISFPSPHPFSAC